MGAMTGNELIGWIREHAELQRLCEVGGWPDASSVHADICGRSPGEWIVNVEFDEYILEISECDLSRHSRCGKFAVAIDDEGRPASMRLLYPM